MRGMNVWAILAAAFVLTVASARLTRLVVQDAYPPVQWLREQWDDRTGTSTWNILLHCHWCFAPWVVLPLGTLGWFALRGADLVPPFEVVHLWWFFGLWMALSYIASWIVNNDEGIVVTKGE
jgi:hypothetical protein